jgi:hypothetical protein
VELFELSYWTKAAEGVKVQKECHQDTLSHWLDELAPATQYCIALRSQNKKGESVWSEALEVTTDGLFDFAHRLLFTLDFAF